jgi:alanine racemase
MKKLTIEQGKMLENLDIVQAAAGGAAIIAVLKANAYGLDMRQMAGLLRERQVRRFAVTEPADALNLREWGFDEEEILVLRSTAVAGDVEIILAAGATATVGSYDAAVALNGIAESHGQTCDAHIKIDTGMGRYGFDSGELERVLSVFRYMTNLSITGMYTHYANAFLSKRKTQAQYDAFVAFIEKIRQAGYNPGLLHASNSAALLKCQMPSMDAVRVGSALGGRITAKGDFGLHKVGRLETEVAEVRWLPKGHPVGYGSAFVTRKPTKVAVIPLGTADGFMAEKARDTYRLRDSFRGAASLMLGFVRRKRFYVTVEGRRARILGHVGVSHTVADITDVDCAPGARAVFEVSPIYVPAAIMREYV